jgi:hypothetical protein
MISEEESISIMLEWFPEFEARYIEHIGWWEGEERLYGLDMAAFSSYATVVITSGKDEEIDRLADFSELMILEGNEKVQWAIKLEFLENITNYGNSIPIERFTSKAKPNTKRICKELDMSWGTQTKGL